MALSSIAQSQFMLYQMNNRLPQSGHVNPSFFPDYKITVGLPFVSTTYLSLNTGKLTFNNAFTRSSDDSLRFNPTNLASKLDKSNRLEVNGNTQLFQFGIRVNRNFFTLTLSERVDGGIVYPGSLVKFLGTGTGQTPGEVFAFENLGMQTHWYQEMALGYGRQVSDRFGFGVRAKLLSGVAGLNIDNVSGVLISDVDSLYINTSAIDMHTSGTEIFENTDFDKVFNTATAFKNIGYALDIGFNFEVINNLVLSASLTDLGVINWKNNTKLFTIDEVSYSFKGENFLDVVSGNNNFDAFGQIADTLQVLYEVDTIENISYKTPLTSKFYAGANYNLGKMHSFGFLFYGDVFKGTFNPGVGLSYNLTIGHIWSIGVSASYRNKSFENFGVGTTITLGPIQVYALSENLMAIAQIADANYVDARVGINLVFGKVGESTRVKKEKEPKKSKESKVRKIDMGSR